MNWPTTSERGIGRQSPAKRILKALSTAAHYGMRQSLQLILSSYPRSREPLTARLAELYIDEYCRNREGKKGLPAVVARLESWMHKSIATEISDARILELGGGTLNHVPYEKDFRAYDVVEPFRELWVNSGYRNVVSAIYEDIAWVPNGTTYDRTVSVAVLEHLTDLPRVMASCAILLADGGEFRAGIPTEGGLLWGLSWRLTTGISFRVRTGLSYAAIMRHEHVNTADEIVAVARYLFENVRIHRFPLPIKHLSFYTVLCASNPCLDRCRACVQAEAKPSH